jgi:putative methionine-R-sulfoxide reductase with GAF domain
MDAGHGMNEPLRAEAERIRRSGDYRWVGIYAVDAAEIRALAWTGEAPAFPAFPRDRGLCGAAVAARATVSVGDVRSDPRYLTTFGSTRSEIVVPVFADDEPVGVVDVESAEVDAFGDDDRARLEAAAAALAPLLVSESRTKR